MTIASSSTGGKAPPSWRSRRFHAGLIVAAGACAVVAAASNLASLLGAIRAETSRDREHHGAPLGGVPPPRDPGPARRVSSMGGAVHSEGLVAGRSVAHASSSSGIYDGASPASEIGGSGIAGVVGATGAKGGGAAASKVAVRKRINVQQQLKGAKPPATDARIRSDTSDTATIDTGANNVSVVSYSAWGNLTRYLIALLVNAESLAPRHYPGWQVRIYHDSTVPPRVLSQLRTLAHVRLVNVANVGKLFEPLLPAEWAGWLPKINPASWRFLVAADPGVDRYVVRDSDSLIDVREKSAVDEWIESGSPFHVMHDNPRHYFWNNKNVTMMAGMWGGLTQRSGIDLDMIRLLREWYENSRLGGRRDPTSGTFVHGDDQDFLAYRIWPFIESLGPRGSVRHNSYHCESNDGVAFPSAVMSDVGDQMYDFVGMVSLYRQDKKGRFERKNEDVSKCTLRDVINDPSAGDGWRERYARCIRRRTERGLNVATHSSALPLTPLKCELQEKI